MADSFPDYYAILEIPVTATEVQIREAYKRKALKTHPDRFVDNSSSADSYPCTSEEAKIEFQRVADAYYVLSDPKRREQYDIARKRKRSGSSIWLQNKPDPDYLFGNVFEEMLRPEVENPAWFYTPLGAASGALLGFICGNVPGLMLGAYAGSKLGAVRDAKGVSVYQAYQKLSGSHKAAILAALAAKLIITIFVQSENASSERRFDKGITIGELKAKLEPITGISTTSQQLQLYNGDIFVASVEGDGFMLGAFPVDNYMTLKVIDSSPTGTRNQFTDLSLVEKYELPDDEYAKRSDSVLAFKQRNKLGRFADSQSSTSDASLTFEEEAKNIKVGDRCEVDFSESGEDGFKKRGIVRYVGETKFKPGYWVGVEYDEPVGKHNGTVQDETYFQARPKHGAFVRPNKVKVGDYPEEEIEEM
ncbi:2226_t:CDS:10 [Ambispora leptoticha]|uniref:2226_t:CDS:1 n=1 Tax=Ambispora leptoticha TaxID=144679 RepID=A0A9N8V8R7_9GLOM|nr:2226_t:CDS:10 [Ambispora leptoticha]